MLSRVAERMYWLGRYIERAEDTARLVGVNAALALDMPGAGPVVWRSLPDIIDCKDQFTTLYGEANERNVVKFMLVDAANAGSLLNSVASARENVRTTREVLPNETWEIINELYLYTREHVGPALTRGGRHEFLQHVMRSCHEFSGQLLGTLSRNQAYHFMQIGRSVERADMTTRILDVAAKELLPIAATLPETYRDMLWIDVLRSLSAYQMYRQQVRDRVNAEDVVEFLFKDMEFPRAVLHCLAEIDKGFYALPQSASALETLLRAQDLTLNFSTEDLRADRLHAFIDDLQLALAHIHLEVERAWFGHAPEEAKPPTSVQAQR